MLLEGTLDTPTAKATLNVKNTTMGTRMAGLSLVMVGADGVALDVDSQGAPRIGDIRSCIAFCNRLARARWAKNTIGDKRLTAWARKQAVQSGNEVDATIENDLWILGWQEQCGGAIHRAGPSSNGETGRSASCDNQCESSVRRDSMYRPLTPSAC